MRLDAKTYVSHGRMDVTGTFFAIENTIVDNDNESASLECLFVNTFVLWLDGHQAANLNIIEYRQLISDEVNKTNLLSLFNLI